MKHIFLLFSAVFSLISGTSARAEVDITTSDPKTKNIHLIVDATTDHIKFWRWDSTQPREQRQVIGRASGYTYEELKKERAKYKKDASTMNGALLNTALNPVALGATLGDKSVYSALEGSARDAML